MKKTIVTTAMALCLFAVGWLVGFHGLPTVDWSSSGLMLIAIVVAVGLLDGLVWSSRTKNTIMTVSLAVAFAAFALWAVPLVSEQYESLVPPFIWAVTVCVIPAAIIVIRRVHDYDPEKVKKSEASTPTTP